MDNSMIVLVEAVIYAAGKRGVTRNTITEKTELTAGEIEYALSELKAKYPNDGTSGLVLNDYGELLSISTYSKVSEKVGDILLKDKQKELSGVLLETLAIIAYQQPVTRSEIENIRGVNCDYAVNFLVASNMIYASGRRETAGYPKEYSTTDEFLLRFELKSRFELKNMADISSKLMAMTEATEKAYLFEEVKPDFEPIQFDESAELVSLEDEGPSVGAGEEDALDSEDEVFDDYNEDDSDNSDDNA